METLLILNINGLWASITNSDNLWTTAGQVILFFTYLVGQILAWKQAGRQRQWQIEDRDELAKTTHETAAKLAQSTGIALKAQTADVVNQVGEKLVEQTKELTEAQRTRITDLGLSFDNLLKEESKKRRADDKR